MIYPALGIGAVAAALLLCTGSCSGSKKKAATTDAAVAQATSCIFCAQSVTNKKSVVEAQKIGETKEIRTLLDTVPILPGHLLLTTVEHKVRAHELSESEVLAEHAALKQIVALYKTKYGAENYLILQKNGRPAGQSVPHYHKHVYPIASAAERTRANWNFAIKFFTFGLCSTKLQGQKLANLQRELTPLMTAVSSQVTTTEKKEEDKKVAAVASCALCPTATSNAAEPLVKIVVVAKQIGPGHVIIQTTRHVEKAHERTPEEVVACHKALQKVVRAYKTVFATDDYVQIEENGKASGQEFLHFHTQVYAVPKTKQSYLRQMEAFLKYSLPSTRTAASPHTKFTEFLASQ